MELSALIEQRRALGTEKATLLDTAIAEKRGLNEAETTRSAEIDSQGSALDLAIADHHATEKRNEEQAEARKKAGLDHVAPSDASVVSEPRTYDANGEHSYMKDLAVAQMPWLHGQQGDATQRLARHNYELSVEVANDTKEGRAVARVIRDESRDIKSAQSTITELRSRGKAGAEQRAMTTGSGSGGAFAPPVYLLDLYAPFRTAGRAFINSLQSHPLPSTGMTVDIPAIGNAAAVATQSTQNSGVGETDPNSSYLSANVTTLAGEITVSQQLLDRSGPWDGSYDAVMFDQLTRDYNTQADAFALAAALTGAGTIAYTTTLNMANTYSKINGAQSVIRSTNGVFRNPTAAFLIPARWSYLAAQVDSSGRPLLVPNTQSPMNAMIAGGDSPGVEGFTGYNGAGLDFYQDASIPLVSTTDQIIVLDPSAVLVFEGDVVPRVLPQTLGNQLSVILQVYAYIAVLPLYPLAVQSITGSSLVAPTF